MAKGGDLRGIALHDALMAIKPAELSATAWAVGAKVNRAFFSNLKQLGNSPRSDTLDKLLEFIGRTHEDLKAAMKGEAVEKPGPKPQPKPIKPASSDDDDVVDITAIDLSLSMGPGTLIEDFPEEEPVKMGLRLIQSITRTPTDRLRLVKGIGDSMEPTLRTGDRIMVDMNERQLARAHGIYWIDHLGEHGVKRLRTSRPGKIMVMSDNPLVPDYEVDAADLRIEGRVIWFAREL